MNFYYYRYWLQKSNQGRLDLLNINESVSQQIKKIFNFDFIGTETNIIERQFDNKIYRMCLIYRSNKDKSFIFQVGVVRNQKNRRYNDTEKKITENNIEDTPYTFVIIDLNDYRQLILIEKNNQSNNVQQYIEDYLQKGLMNPEIMVGPVLEEGALRTLLIKHKIVELNLKYFMPNLFGDFLDFNKFLKEMKRLTNADNFEQKIVSKERIENKENYFDNTAKYIEDAGGSFVAIDKDGNRHKSGKYIMSKKAEDILVTSIRALTLNEEKNIEIDGMIEDLLQEGSVRNNHE